MEYKYSTIVELAEKRKIPQMVKHCVIKVFKGGKSNKKEFMKAFLICIATFKKHGYMYKNAHSKMTFKGIKRNRMHLREASLNVRKNAKFKQLYQSCLRKQIDAYKDESRSKKTKKKVSDE